MARLTISIDMAGAAFEPCPAHELARLLRLVARKAESTIGPDGLERELHPMDPAADRFAGTLRDVNRNTCGEYAVEGGE